MPTPRREQFLPNPNPNAKLLDQCREVIRFRHFSRLTEQTYLHWVRRFLQVHRLPGIRVPESWRHIDRNLLLTLSG